MKENATRKIAPETILRLAQKRFFEPCLCVMQARGCIAQSAQKNHLDSTNLLKKKTGDFSTFVLCPPSLAHRWNLQHSVNHNSRIGQAYLSKQHALSFCKRSKCLGGWEDSYRSGKKSRFTFFHFEVRLHDALACRQLMHCLCENSFVDNTQRWRINENIYPYDTFCNA